MDYGFYSKLLKKPFDSLKELQEAEATYKAERQAKEDAAAAKKADADVVETAFKELNAARKVFTEQYTALNKNYTAALTELRTAYEKDRKALYEALAAAEEKYNASLKAFTDKYGNFHLTLKDGDHQMTISNKTVQGDVSKRVSDLFNLFWF